MYVGRRGAAFGVNVSDIHEERGIHAIADVNLLFYIEQIPTKIHIHITLKSILIKKKQ